MAKKCCLRHLKKHLGGSEASEIEKLFIETSLGTRLLTIIHRSATVSDAKTLDHSQAFPGMGEVRMINLQVQHQGHFYHLSESMTLATAFGEPKRDRFLFSEASICEPDEKVGVDHGTGNVNSVSNHVGRFLLLLPAGQEVSAGPSDGDSGRTAVPLAQFTYEEELLQDHLDDDGSGHVVQALQNGHPLVTDEDLATNPDTPEASSKETSIPHGTKKRKRVKKEISYVGEQSTVGTDKNDDVVPQNENDVSNVVEMARNVSADLLLQNEATGNAGSISPKKKRRKVERRMVGNAATDHGLSSAPFEEVVNEDTNPQITLTQQAAPQPLEPVDVSGVLSQGKNVEVQNQEGTLPPSDACLNKERAADIDGNVRRDDNGGADEYLVAGQSEDVQCQVMYNNHQQNGTSGNRKEKKKKKTKRSRSSAAEDLLTSGMEEQSHGAEVSGAPLMPIHEVGDKSSKSMDVSVSVAPGEGEEAQVLLPLVCVHADHENTAKEKKKKTKKKSRSSAEDIAATEIKELSHGAEGLVAPLIPIEEVGDKTSQSMDVSVSVAPREGEETLQKQEVLLPLVGVHPGQENTEGLDAKEKQKKKRKKIRSSAAKHGAEGLVASLIPIQEVGDKATHSVDVSVSVAPSEGEEALQKQEALLPRVDIHPDHVNTEELDGNAREVESATDDPVVTKPIVEDQLVRGQEKGSNLMKEKKIETGISDVSKVAKDADDQIDFLKYFMPAKSPFDIKSSVNVKGTSQSIKQKKVKGQLDTASSTLSETQESRKSQDAQEANDKKLEQSAEPKKILPLKNKKLSKPSQDGCVVQISALEKGKKTATSGPAVAVQNSKIAKQQQALNRNAMSTAGKGSNGRSLLKSSGKANSLFNPERKLFTDSESESSSGENKSTNSDASTLPPSRSSSSSSDSSSDSESDASQTSIRKGTATKTSNGTGKSVSSKKRVLAVNC